MFALCFILCSNNAFGQVNASCTYNGIPLYGKVKVVENFEDFKVKVVNNFEDLKVDTQGYLYTTFLEALFTIFKR